MILHLHRVPNVNELAVLKDHEIVFLRECLQTMNSNIAEISDDINVSLKQRNIRPKTFLELAM